MVAEIVAETAPRCYGVVGLSAGSRVGRILRREAISVEGDARGFASSCTSSSSTA